MTASKYKQLFGFVSILSCMYCIQSIDQLSRDTQQGFVDFCYLENKLKVFLRGLADVSVSVYHARSLLLHKVIFSLENFGKKRFEKFIFVLL